MYDIKIRPAAFDEPAVAALLIDVLAELSERYGGSGDDTPVDPAEFVPPNGAFFVAVETVPADPATPPTASPAAGVAGLSGAGSVRGVAGLSGGGSVPGGEEPSGAGSVPGGQGPSGGGSAPGTEEFSSVGSGPGAERLIGCAGWRRHGEDAELKRMYTAKAARGRGLGRRLLATIEDSAREAGCPRLILETGDRQPEAIALYESAGYVRIKDFGYYAGEEGVLSFAKAL